MCNHLHSENKLRLFPGQHDPDLWMCLSVGECWVNRPWRWCSQPRPHLDSLALSLFHQHYTLLRSWVTDGVSILLECLMKTRTVLTVTISTKISVNWWVYSRTRTVLCMCVFSAPEDFRLNPGAVEAVLQHPAQPEKVQHLLFFLWLPSTLDMQCTVKYRGSVSQ